MEQIVPYNIVIKSLSEGIMNQKLTKILDTVKKYLRYVYDFLKKYLCYISCAVALLTFFFPIQVAYGYVYNEEVYYYDDKRFKSGFDMMFGKGIIHWEEAEGKLCAAIVSLIVFGLAVYATYLAIKRLIRVKRGVESAEFASENKIFILNFIVACAYLFFGILIKEVTALYGLKSRTLSYIPFIMQCAVFVFHRLTKEGGAKESNNAIERKENADTLSAESAACEKKETVATENKKNGEIDVKKLKKETKFWWKIYVLLPKIAFFTVIGVCCILGMIEDFSFVQESPILSWLYWMLIGGVSALLTYAIIKIHTSPIILHVLSLEEKEKREEKEES